MLDQVFDQVENVAKAWEQEIKRRRAITRFDPISDVMEHQATELRSVLAQLRADWRTLTPDQYAKLVGKSASTVRRWCASGQLACIADASGDLHIPAGATRKAHVA